MDIHGMKNGGAKPTRILMVCYIFPPEFGGAIVQALRLSTELSSRGYRVSFLADNGSRPGAVEVYDGFDLFRLRTGADDQKSMFRQLAWALRVIWFVIGHPEFQVLHFHGVRGAELLCMPIIRLLGRKSLVKLTLAGSDDPQTLSGRRLMGRIYAACMRRVDKFIAISPILQNMAINSGVDRTKVSLIANGVDVGNYHVPSPEEVLLQRSALGIPQDAALLVSIGAVEHRKGYDTLLEAFQLVRQKNEKAQLLIVGPENVQENPFFVSLQKYLSQQRIEGVHFLGRRSDVQNVLMASDLFVFCSRQEGFGTVIVEAMCCGLSVVVMDIPGITEWIIGDRPAAVNCQDRDPQVFAAECLRLLETRSPEIAQDIARLARRDFGILTIADSYAEIYEDIALG